MVEWLYLDCCYPDLDIKMQLKYVINYNLLRRLHYLIYISLSFRVNWIMSYKKMTVLCSFQLFMEGNI